MLHHLQFHGSNTQYSYFLTTPSDTMDTVVYNSDSTTLRSTRGSSSCSKVQKCDIPSVSKCPNLNFSWTDDSDADCSSNFKTSKLSSEPNGPDPFRKTDSCLEVKDLRFEINSEISSKEYIYVSPRSRYFFSEMLEVGTLKKKSDIMPQGNKSKVIRKKLSEEQQRLLKEKNDKMSERALQKALKKVIAEAHKAKKADECMKYIQVQIDQSLLSEEFSEDFLLILQSYKIQYYIQEQLSEKSITWVKTVNSYHYDHEDKIIITPNLKEENLVLIIMTSKKFMKLIKTRNLRYHVQKIRSQQGNKKIILVIHKLEEYYRSQFSKKQSTFEVRCENEYKINPENDVHQYIDIEKALIEIQVLDNCSHRFVETIFDLGSLVAQLTKSLAQKDFRLEKQEKMKEKFEWFAPGDSCDTVKADGNGLMKLWKQQLCQFGTASRVTANAIASLYPSPKSLIQAYENCSTKKEAQLLLQNITLQRGTVRRIGPELSKKMYCFFTEWNENHTL